MLKLPVLLTVLPALVAAQVNSQLPEAEPDDGASLKTTPSLTSTLPLFLTTTQTFVPSHLL